jgi:hypothetical protein
MGEKVNIMPGGRVNDGLGDVFVMLSCVFFKGEGFAVLLICCFIHRLFSYWSCFDLYLWWLLYYMSPRTLDVSFN